MDEESEEGQQEEQQEPKNYVVAIPTIEYFIKSYARGSSQDDQKAVRVFVEYESREKLTRLRNELSLVKKGQVSPGVCDRIIGPARKARFTTHEAWAGAVTMWSLKKS